jgi:hypothetical protein
MTSRPTVGQVAAAGRSHRRAEGLQSVARTDRLALTGAAFAPAIYGRAFAESPVRHWRGRWDYE